MKKRLVVVLLFVFIFSLGAAAFFSDIEKTYESSYSYGDQTVEINSILALDTGFLIVGRDRSRGLAIILDDDFEEVSCFHVTFPLQAGKVVGEDLVLSGANKIIKVDKEGNYFWRRELTGEVHDIKQGNDGFFIVGQKNNKAWVAKLDKRGRLDWERKSDGAGFSTFHSALLSEDDYLLVVGEKRRQKSWEIDSKGWAVKVSPKGDEIWNRTFVRDGGWSNSINLILETKDGSYLLAGDDGYILKMSSKAEVLWEKSQPGFTVSYYAGVQVGEKFVLTGVKREGRPRGGGAKNYPYLSWIEADGSKVEEEIFTGVQDGRFKDIVFNEGEVVVVGSAKGPTLDYNTKGYLVKKEGGE